LFFQQNEKEKKKPPGQVATTFDGSGFRINGSGQIMLE